ncbi:MAG TPA: M23 family metallopeptidase [Candidatus Dependentiae bacterium]|nr:M23 family metallopeptidase [Candidatus Dependentiae bacterium]
MLWIIGIVIISTSIILGLLVKEYHYFKHQAEKVAELQSEYRNYVIAVRRLLKGSSIVKENNGADVGADEKKKGDDSDGWLIVNRSVDYLKDSSASFYKSHHMSKVFNTIPSDTWLEYTDLVLAEEAKSKQPKKSPVRRRKRPLRVQRHSAKRTQKSRGLPLILTSNSAKMFSWPIDPARFWLSSLYGPRKNPKGWKFHHGLDMAAMRGTPVKAAAQGQVVEVRYDMHGYGKMVMVEHSSQHKTRYAHLDKILVNVGQQVERGTVIGRVGATGNVRSMGFDGSHLHFEVLVSGHTANPLHFLG